MKKYKFLAIMVLICLAAASFFLRYKSYYISFIFTSDQKSYERVIDDFFSWSIIGKLCFLAVFTPAAAIAALQTKLEKNLVALLTIALISSVITLAIGFNLWFGIFEVQVKLLFGYFLFVGLGGFGCVIFWIITAREIWHRIRNRRQTIKTA